METFIVKIGIKNISKNKFGHNEKKLKIYPGPIIIIIYWRANIRIIIINDIGM